MKKQTSNLVIIRESRDFSRCRYADFLLLSFIILILFASLVLSQTHPANQIKPGNFSVGNYEFAQKLYISQGVIIRGGDLDLNNNALLNVDWASTSTTGLDADTLDGVEASGFYQGSVSSWANGDTLPTCASGSHLYNNGGVLACSSTDDDVPESGDFGAAADLDSAGQVADDSHNHIYSNIDSTTSANWASIVSDETGTGNMVFSTSPTLTTPRIAEVRAASSAGLKLYDDSGTAGLFVEDGGNVGIATTNPTVDLDIRDTTNATLNIQSSGASANIELRGYSNDDAYIDFSTDSSVDYSGRIEVVPYSNPIFDEMNFHGNPGFFNFVGSDPIIGTYLTVQEGDSTWGQIQLQAIPVDGARFIMRDSSGTSDIYLDTDGDSKIMNDGDISINAMRYNGNYEEWRLDMLIVSMGCYAEKSTGGYIQVRMASAGTSCTSACTGTYPTCYGSIFLNGGAGGSVDTPMLYKYNCAATNYERYCCCE